MALYGGQRDVSLFRSLNRELLHRIIDTEVLFYKLIVGSTPTNIYDESDGKVYESPVTIHTLITREDPTWTGEDYGMEINQGYQIAFLRDDLVDTSLVPEVGDIFEYNSSFYEIDSVIDNQLFVGKNPDSWFGGSEHGYNISVICSAHLTRQSKLNITKVRFGNSVSSNNNTILPNNV